MKEVEYVYAVARIRANEISLLTSSEMNALIAAKDLTEALRRLAEKGYNIEKNTINTMIKEQTKKTWSLLKEILPDITELDCLILKNDFHNLKSALKCIISNENPTEFMLSPSIIPKDEILRIIQERKFDELPEYMQKATKEAYDIIVRSGHGQAADSILDRATLEGQIFLSKKSGSVMLYDYAVHSGICANIKIAYRGMKTKKDKSFFERSMCRIHNFNNNDLIVAALSGEDDFFGHLSCVGYKEAAEFLQSSTSAFEKWCDDKTMKIIEKGKMTAFGIDPVAAFYLAKEAEILSVRIILSAKTNGISEAIIRERVRELYA